MRHSGCGGGNTFLQVDRASWGRSWQLRLPDTAKATGCPIASAAANCSGLFKPQVGCPMMVAFSVGVSGVGRPLDL